jgi:two-component system OmpR family response regulator
MQQLQRWRHSPVLAIDRLCSNNGGCVGVRRRKSSLGAAPMRILLVEDHPDLSRQVAEKIHRAGYNVDSVDTIEDADRALERCAYALALIDRRLPDGDGIALVPRMRRKRPDIRILLLTALDAVDNRIEGLEAGADDYLTKPFNLDELVARIRANLRKHSSGPTPPVQVGALRFDLENRAVHINGTQALLSRRELILLETLVRRANCVVSRETLHAELYGYGEEVQDHALTSLVSRLRARLAAMSAGAEIFSARSLGYILREIREREERR